MWCADEGGLHTAADPPGLPRPGPWPRTAAVRAYLTSVSTWAG